jgi:putative ATP-dependent endonuclease of the OLD family
LRIQAKLSQDFHEEYTSFVTRPEAIRLVPTEYYRVDWLGFSGNAVSTRSVPATAAVIDPMNIRLQSGVDYHLQEIIRTHLNAKERVELSREYRSLREEFSGREAVKEINKRLETENDNLTDRKLSLAIDISNRYTWEGSLITHLDDLPFHLIGRGDQNSLKTLLAIGRKADGAQIVLVEEPETHLSHSSLRKLINRVDERCSGKQLVIATHSTYVLNKLGLQNLVLLGGEAAAPTRIVDLPAGTVEYFKKLAGFDTLRLVLADAAILVEGPSDELIIQRAYKDVKGRLPIDDGIDVISVGLSHKRFLDLAVRLKRRVWVVTDNDGKTYEQVKERFSDYLDNELVSLHVARDPRLCTLEPCIADANGLDTLNVVLGTQCTSKEELVAGMSKDKTASALRIFEAKDSITMPGYIQDVLK